jgi:hypothetical protein
VTRADSIDIDDAQELRLDYLSARFQLDERCGLDVWLTQDYPVVGVVLQTATMIDDRIDELADSVIG